MSVADQNTVTLLAVGDIGPLYEPGDQLAELILPTLRQADLRFGQCERAFSEKYGGPPGSSCLKPKVACLWKTSGIEVISLASNHTMDGGSEALLETMDLFRGMGGKYLIGAGKDEEEARKPAIVERNGLKIAFLGYCSAITEGHEAGKKKPGTAPMRIHTYYERGKDQTEEFHPGVPPFILTVPFEEDLHALENDIRKAKQQADLVVMSIHWGIHMIPKAIAGYESVVARAAIDAGADLILGHGPHCLKAVEVYKGKVCFHSLGNFMMPSRPRPVNPADWCRWNLFWYRLEPEYLPPNSIFSAPPDCRMTMLAKIVFGKIGVERVSFLPAFINPMAQPAVVKPDNPKFREIREYVEWISDLFATKFRVEGDEVVIETST